MKAMPEKANPPGLRQPPKIIPSSKNSDSVNNSSIQPPPHLQPRQFKSHSDASDISPMAKILCETLVRAPPGNIESVLGSTGILSTPALVEEVLRFSYNYPASAVKFFRWAGLTHKHSTHSWNLMVDLLGKNELFEQMWDAMRSMKQEGTLSVATFVSVFGSYCSSGRFSEAIMSFDVMDKYGVEQDVYAANSLLGAICREDNQTSKAMEFYDKIKTKINPDGDTFAILFEGWQKEGNVSKAKTTFGEMVVRLGWSPLNSPAYDAFLMTLIRGSEAEEAIKFLQAIIGKSCLPGLKFFSNALDVLVMKDDSRTAVQLWDTMVGNGSIPNLTMYNAMIGLLCKQNEISRAFQLLDSMVFHGAFPDSLAYNTIFHCLVKTKEVRRAAKFFSEMVKNEFPPTPSNCAAAIAMFFEGDDPETGTEIWNFMVDGRYSHLDAGATALLLGLQKMGRLSEVRRFLEDMLDRGINLSKSTMEKLKDSFYREGRSSREAFDRISRRWKTK